jgi:hypothetical protein
MLQIGKGRGLAERFGQAFTVSLILLSLVVIGNPAQASQLNLELQTSPDMMSDFINVSYNAANQTFTARGFAEQIGNGAGEPIVIVNGTFEITASISSSGTVSSGTLTITGEVPSLGINQGTLLTGNISALGFGEASGPMEFRFDTNGGSLAFNFGPSVSIILSQSGFAGTFTDNFSSNSIAVAGIGW